MRQLRPLNAQPESATFQSNFVHHDHSISGPVYNKVCKVLKHLFYSLVNSSPTNQDKKVLTPAVKLQQGMNQKGCSKMQDFQSGGPGILTKISFVQQN